MLAAPAARTRAETLEIFEKLSAAEWERGGVHPTLGRFTVDAILSIVAWHDDNHLDQLGRARHGRA